MHFRKNALTTYIRSTMPYVIQLSNFILIRTTYLLPNYSFIIILFLHYLAYMCFNLC